MHLVHCNNPIKVFNKYTGEFVWVPCRQCEVCRNLYQLTWQNRLLDEMRVHPYNIFFTLTYNERSIPYMEWYKDRYLVSDDGVFIDTYDYLDSWSPEDYEYIRKLDKLKICDKKHIDEFIKRLRSRIDYKYGKKIRFFVCAEYDPCSEDEKQAGSTPHRPHYHGLLFVDDKEVFNACLGDTGFICKSWQHGFTSAKPANEKRARYVAKYVSGDTHLPAVYSCREIRTFYKSSRRPPIGYKEFSMDNFKDNFFESSLFLGRQTDKGLEYELLPKYIETKLFPRCLEFDKIDHAVRLALYSYACPEIDYGYKYTYTIRSMPDIDVVDFHIFFPGHKRWSHCFHSVDAFNNFIRWSNNVYSAWKVLDCNFVDYVINIEKYWNRKGYYKLVEQLRFEEEFGKNDDTRLLINLDLDFMERLNSCTTLDDLYLDVSMVKTLYSFGIKPEVFFHSDGSVDYSMLSAYRYQVSKDYLKRRSLAYKISVDSVKTKKRNDYKNKLVNDS